MKIVFMGTPDFAAGVLESLVESGEHEITCVVTQPDKAKGRSNKTVPGPVKEYAEKCGIPVFQPVKIKNADSVEELRKYEADIFVVAAFGQILPKEVLEMPRFGCINVHASLLPKYRGAAPIQWAIADGEKITGVTIMQMNEGLDTGDIITQEEVEIDKTETGESLFNKLMEKGAGLLIDTLRLIESNKASRVPQNDSESTYARMIKKEMGQIDFSLTSESIDCLIRAFTPWPGGFTYFNGKMLKIKSCEALPEKITSDTENDIEKEPAPGEIVRVTKDKLFVACRESTLAISELQPEGKKAMSVHDFLLGNPVKAGMRLGM